MYKILTTLLACFAAHATEETVPTSVAPTLQVAVESGPVVPAPSSLKVYWTIHGKIEYEHNQTLRCDGQDFQMIVIHNLGLSNKAKPELFEALIEDILVAPLGSLFQGWRSVYITSLGPIVHDHKFLEFNGTKCKEIEIQSVRGIIFSFKVNMSQSQFEQNLAECFGIPNCELRKL